MIDLKIEKQTDLKLNTKLNVNVNVTMNLKVCEGCGALWLRAEAVGGVYCSRCTRVLAEFPPVRRGRMPSRPQLRRTPVARPGLKLVGGAR